MIVIDRVKAAVLGAGPEGITDRIIWAAMPEVRLTTVRKAIYALFDGGVIFSSSFRTLDRRFFAVKADAEAHAEVVAARRKEAKRATNLAWYRRNYVPKPPRERKARPAPKPRPDAWSSEQVKQLRTLYASDLSILAIAKEIGRSPHAVGMKAFKLKLKKAPPIKKPKPPSPPALVRIAAATRGPAYLPGPLIFTDKTRHVIYPSKPAPMRTSTFSPY